MLSLFQIVMQPHQASAFLADIPTISGNIIGSIDINSYIKMLSWAVVKDENEVEKLL